MASNGLAHVIATVHCCAEISAQEPEAVEACWADAAGRLIVRANGCTAMAPRAQAHLAAVCSENSTRQVRCALGVCYGG